MRCNPGNTWAILHFELRQQAYRQRYELSARHAAPHSQLEEQDIFYETAKDVAKRGPEKALKNVPVETVGKWRSADRQEIEGMRSVRNAMRLYMNSLESKPLCLAVFGPPGAGKSFVVQQIAEELQIREDSQLTFNLSQYEHPSELARAFHQIRDIQLRGHKVPLVFWDEFDSPCEGKPIGWLRYFLVPMQDGEFSEGGAIHPVGRGIYVFAGGTCFSYQEFTQCKDEGERSAKKPDFVSRLRAFIDVKGPDCTPDWSHDRFYMIRRALLLHSSLDSHAKGLRQEQGYEFHEGVLRALLRTRKYHHGARSLQNIVKLSNFEGKTKFELSSLPPEHLLQMHVDVNDFMSHMTVGKE
jgi:hypothetical protein